MADDDVATRESPAGGPLPTTELEPATAAAGALAYSVGADIPPVAEFRPPQSRVWWRVAALGAAILTVTGGAAVAILLLGRTPVAQQASAPVVPTTRTTVPTLSPTPGPRGGPAGAGPRTAADGHRHRPAGRNTRITTARRAVHPAARA